MDEFKLIDNQIIFHDKYNQVDKVIFDRIQVEAIKLLIQKYNGKEKDQIR